MKRLLGGAHTKWVGAVTKKWMLSVTGLLLVVFASVVLMAHPGHAAVTNNTPASAQWVNRYYIKDNLGNYYFDNNTYDNTYEYIEDTDLSGTTFCPNHIIFTYNQGPRVPAPNDQTNEDFFYNDPSTTSISNLPNQLWSVKLQVCNMQNNSGGQTQPVITKEVNNFAVNSNSNARRITFYKDNANHIISIASAISFSQKGEFKGVPRYFRDDEVTDNTNSCPDVVMWHNAQPTGDGRSLFHGTSNDIAGSAMLYAVTKDSNLAIPSRSYPYVSGANANVAPDTCRLKSDDINASKGGAYAIAGYNTNADDSKFEAAGLDQNGNTVHGGGQYGTDSFIIFVGDVNNMKQDSAGAVVGTPTANNADKTTGATCKGGSLGWLICPLIEGIQKAIGLLQRVMQAFLLVNPLPISSGPIYDSWVNIRNIANILFVIAFFAIIFSQATSIGISNYGIKRLLPRLVVIAVATNLSYFICSFLIDIFNIMGVGVINLFAIINNGAAGTIDVNNTTSVIAGGGIVLAITWAITSGAIVEIFPLIAAAALAFVLMIVIMILRQAILIFLVVLSPIAFVAGLLPGTQEWLKRWFDMFIALLVMYPLIMGLFAAANIAAAVLSSASGG